MLIAASFGSLTAYAEGTSPPQSSLPSAAGSAVTDSLVNQQMNLLDLHNFDQFLSVGGGGGGGGRPRGGGGRGGGRGRRGGGGGPGGGGRGGGGAAGRARAGGRGR